MAPFSYPSSSLPSEKPAIKVNGKTPQTDNGSAIDRLMREMGSKKGFDPIPPDQYLYFLNDKDPLQRLLAWVRSKTIRRGRRSAFCVDPQGTPLTLEHMRVDFGWSDRYTRQVWTNAETAGLVRKDEEGRLWLCGDVPIPQPPEPDSDESDRICTNPFPDYINQQLQQLSENKRNRLLSDYKAYTQLIKRVKREAMALARAKEEELEKQFFGRFGIEVKYYEKRRESEGDEIVQLSLKDLPEGFVQILNDSVQDDSETLYKPENGSVQNGHPYIHREEEQSREGSPLYAAPEEPLPITPLPPPQPSSAIAVQDPESATAFEIFRTIMDGCGKPVSVRKMDVCRREFFKHPLAVQQHIVEDAAIRAEQIWNEPKWTPDPLDYLKSLIWDEKPVKRRTLARAATNGRQQQSDDAMQRLYERVEARERERKAKQ